MIAVTDLTAPLQLALPHRGAFLRFLRQVPTVHEKLLGPEWYSARGCSTVVPPDEASATSPMWVSTLSDLVAGAMEMACSEALLVNANSVVTSTDHMTDDLWMAHEMLSREGTPSLHRIVVTGADGRAMLNLSGEYIDDQPPKMAGFVGRWRGHSVFVSPLGEAFPRNAHHWLLHRDAAWFFRSIDNVEIEGDAICVNWSLHLKIHHPAWIAAITTIKD